jgi:hypothetical protein
LSRVERKNFRELRNKLCEAFEESLIYAIKSFLSGEEFFVGKNENIMMKILRGIIREFGECTSLEEILKLLILRFCFHGSEMENSWLESSWEPCQTLDSFS